MPESSCVNQRKESFHWWKIKQNVTESLDLIIPELPVFINQGILVIMIFFVEETFHSRKCK